MPKRLIEKYHSYYARHPEASLCFPVGVGHWNRTIIELALHMHSLCFYGRIRQSILCCWYQQILIHKTRLFMKSSLSHKTIFLFGYNPKQQIKSAKYSLLEKVNGLIKDYYIKIDWIEFVSIYLDRYSAILFYLSTLLNKLGSNKKKGNHDVHIDGNAPQTGTKASNGKELYGDKSQQFMKLLRVRRRKD